MASLNTFLRKNAVWIGAATASAAVLFAVIAHLRKNAGGGARGARGDLSKNADAQPLQPAHSEVSVSVAEAKKLVLHILDDYLTSLDAAEAHHALRAISLKDLPVKEAADVLGAVLVSRSVYLLADRSPADVERLAALITQLHQHGFLSNSASETGLSQVLARSRDLALDFPRLHQGLTDFIVWLVLTDVVSEDFMDARHAELHACAAAAAGVSPIEALANVEAYQQRVQAVLSSRIPTPLAQIRSVYRDAIALYLSTGGAALDTLLMELASTNARHALAEFLRRVIIASIEASGATKPAMLARMYSGKDADEAASAPVGISLSAAEVRELCSDLLAELVSVSFVTPFEVASAASAVLREAAELQLDNPDAPTVLGQIIARAVADGALPVCFVAHRRSALDHFEATVSETQAAASSALSAGDESPMPEAPHLNLLARQTSAEREGGGGWVSVTAPSREAGSPLAASLAVSAPAARAAAPLSPQVRALQAMHTALNVASKLLPSNVETAGLTSEDVKRLRSVWGSSTSMTVAESRERACNIGGQFVEDLCSATKVGAADSIMQQALAEVPASMRNATVCAMVFAALDKPAAVNARVSTALCRLMDAGLLTQETLRLGMARVLAQLYLDCGPEKRMAALAPILSKLLYLTRSGYLGPRIFDALPRYLLEAAAADDEDAAEQEASGSSGAGSRRSRKTSVDIQGSWLTVLRQRFEQAMNA